MKILLTLFLAFGTTICAETHSDQQQMADDIYHRSFVPDMGEAFVEIALRSPYQTYIRLDGCDFIMEIHTPSDTDTWVLSLVTQGDVSLLEVQPTPNGTDYDYYATPTQENGVWRASHFTFAHSDGHSFEQTLFSKDRDEAGNLKIMMQYPWSKSLTYVMPNIESEQALADLLADILTYRDSYCLGSS